MTVQLAQLSGLKKLLWAMSSIKPKSQAIFGIKGDLSPAKKPNAISSRVLLSGFRSEAETKATSDLLADLLDGQVRIVPHQEFDEAIQSRNFSLVIIPDAREAAAKAMSFKCLKKSIPVISVPDSHQLFTYDSLSEETLSPCDWLLPTQSLTDVLPKSQGISRTLFAISSNDRLVADELSQADRLGFRQALGSTGDRPLILHAMQGSRNNFVVAEQLDHLAKDLGVDIIHRPHPKQNSLAKLALHGSWTSRSLGSWQAIWASDALVTHSSAMATQSYFLGIPVLLYGNQDQPSLPKLVECANAVWAPTLDQMKRALATLLKIPHGNRPTLATDQECEEARRYLTQKILEKF